MASDINIRRALISVSDKTNVVALAKSLAAFGVEILSTGGTAALLRQHHINVIEVSDYTGFPEIMGGRVKTIHPKVLGGILGRRQLDQEIMTEHGINPIDLVVVNLYPFAQTIANPHHTLGDAIENIDIGGPNMIRAAAKNHQDVAVVVDPNDYTMLLNIFKTNTTIDAPSRFNLAKKAFAHTAHYDASIANYLGKISFKMEAIESAETTGSTANTPNYQTFPDTISLQFDKKIDLRYGENPHQRAAFYVEKSIAESASNNASNNLGIAQAKQLQGKALSYNNIADADAALSCVQSFSESEPTCVIVKHANPCGVAQADNLLLAYERAYKTDPSSSFGGIIAFNAAVGDKLMNTIIQQQFVEVIIAPEYSAEAIKAATAKPNIRLLSTGYWRQQNQSYHIKGVNGGLLIQDEDLKLISESDLNYVSKRKPSATEIKNLLFAWKVVKFVKSNAIVYAKDNMTMGIGAGQMSRVYSAKIAQIKAQDENLAIAGSVMASDAFFPFRDSIDAAAKAGVTAIIQPGGSIRDEEVINAANEANIAMVFTAVRHFRH